MTTSTPTRRARANRFSFIDELSAAVDTIVAAADVAPSPYSVVLMQPLGGAFGRVGGMDTALGHRDAEWGMQVLASWYEPERDAAGVCSAYGAERYARLVEVKDRWDPENVFRLNHNIEPSGG